MRDGVIVDVHRYHDATKHHFTRFARSLGYLDWASQPDPFRTYAGAPTTALAPRPDAPPFDVAQGRPERSRGAPLSSPIGVILRQSLGLTAWKRFRASPARGGGADGVESRWSLRANPSSGNLHPTEAYVVLADGVHHYSPDRHELERRCAWAEPPLPPDLLLVALTSIHWREAWKYGERAFRYCQHDLGHAIAAIRIAASIAGANVRLLPEWSQSEIAAVAGIDRDDDYVDAEREEPGAILAVSSRPFADVSAPRLVAAARAGVWTGRASQLSEDHVQWTFIDEIAAVTRDPGRVPAGAHAITNSPIRDLANSPYPAGLLLQRRSAVAFDGQSSIGVDRFIAMLSRVMPEHPPFDALWWDARIHLALFVHRVDGLEPGLYLLLRDPQSGERLKSALGREFLMQPAAGSLPLVCLARGDCRHLARRLSCDQDIAADGFFSVAMIAEFDKSLDDYGPSFYRHLFWETGAIGQVLYLEAEAAGARGTGIGCFYDDPVHDVLGLTGHAFQSLYHFTIGMPVEDVRLTTEPGYSWEERSTIERRAR